MSIAHPLFQGPSDASGTHIPPGATPKTRASRVVRGLTSPWQRSLASLVFFWNQLSSLHAKEKATVTNIKQDKNVNILRERLTFTISNVWARGRFFPWKQTWQIFYTGLIPSKIIFVAGNVQNENMSWIKKNVLVFNTLHWFSRESNAFFSLARLSPRSFPQASDVVVSLFSSVEFPVCSTFQRASAFGNTQYNFHVRWSWVPPTS